jgi:TonB family protein
MEYLVNSLWQAPLLALTAWLVLRAGRPGPRAQHGVWVGALALMVAMPLLSLRSAGEDATVVRVAAPVSSQSSKTAQTQTVRVRPGQPAVAKSDATPASADWPRAVEQNAALHNVAPSKVVPQASGHRRDASSGSSQNAAGWLRTRELRLSAAATRLVVELYLAVVAFAMMRLLWSWRVARRMVAEAVAAELTATESALLDDCCERLRVQRPRVLTSAKTSSPLVVGAARPALLLPESFAERGGETVENAGRGVGLGTEYFARELEAVWWHELAHVRRRDYLANLLLRIWALPVAYHPATYVVERRVRRTREMVCDRIAAEAMRSRVGYARCLLGLAQRMHAGCAMEQMHAAGLGLDLFGDGVLEERVMELIETKPAVSLRMRALRLAGGLAMVLAVACAAAMFHVTPTMAQEQATPQTANQVPSAGQSDSAGAAAQTDASLQTADLGRPVARSLSAAEREEMRQAMVDAQAEAAEATRLLNGPELRKQLEDARTQARAGAMSPEVRKQIEDATRQAQAALAKLNDPEFKKQIEDARTQALAAAMGPEVRQRIEDAKRQAQAALARLNDPEFKKQIEDARTQALAAAMGPELGQQIEDAKAQAAKPTEPQIRLKVRFVSYDRTLARQLGVNLFSPGAANSIGAVTTQRLSPPSSSCIPGTPGIAASPTGATVSDPLDLFIFRPDLNLGATVEALQTQQVVQVLSEPDLLTANGKEGSFLAGGQYPFPAALGANGTCAITIEFREFGVRLNIIPTITPRGSIRLQVAPEVSSLDFANGVTTSGFKVPGLDVRKAKTEVELGQGQSFAIGGLLDSRSAGNFSKIPFRGDIPVLGKFFQSVNTSKTDTELIAIVTPEIVQPIPVGAVPVPSGTMAESVISRPDPVYPVDAKAARVQGAVVLDAVISKEGTVERLDVVSGPEMLQASAAKAVKNWKYKPYLVDGWPVEVETTITVNFTIGW